MKVICKKQFKSLEGILDLNDIIELETIVTDKDVKVMKRVFYEKGGIKGSKIELDYIIPAGSYKGYRFTSKNGNVYDDHCIHVRIGYPSLKEIFNKI